MSQVIAVRQVVRVPLPRHWLTVTLLVPQAKAQVRQEMAVLDFPTAASEGRVFHKCVLTSPNVVEFYARTCISTGTILYPAFVKDAEVHSVSSKSSGSAGAPSYLRDSNDGKDRASQVCSLARHCHGHTSEWHTCDTNLGGLWSDSFDSDETLKESVGMLSVIEGRTIDILGLQRCAFLL